MQSYITHGYSYTETLDGVLRNVVTVWYYKDRKLVTSTVTTPVFNKKGKSKHAKRIRL